MGIVPFERWCARAAGGIRIRSDRKEVYEELYAHMEDQYEELLAAGYTEAEAENEVLSAMGDAWDTARQLERIHRPLWAYALLSIRILAFGVFLWAVFAGLGNVESIAALFRPLVDGECYAVSLWHAQDTKLRCGAYTLCLCRAAYAEDRRTGELCLLMELRTFTPDPFLGQPLFVNPPMLEDSRGQVYPVVQVESRDLVFSGRRLWIVNLADRDADWAVLSVKGPEDMARFLVRLQEGGA